MSARQPAYQASPTNPGIEEIQTIPERRVDMPYAPAIRVEAPRDLLFISGATPSPLYHKHPHQLHEHDHPVSIKEQTRRAMETIKTILDLSGTIASASTSAEVARLVTANVALSQVKEATGLERATLSNAFAAGRFAPGQYEAVVTLRSAQNDAGRRTSFSNALSPARYSFESAGRS